MCIRDRRVEEDMRSERVLGLIAERVRQGVEEAVAARVAEAHEEIDEKAAQQLQAVTLAAQEEEERESEEDRLARMMAENRRKVEIAQERLALEIRKTEEDRLKELQEMQKAQICQKQQREITERNEKAAQAVLVNRGGNARPKMSFGLMKKS
eukprot:TRINITY_DN18472_c0_g1_i2.p1 TRINITY_DN18472_c0_g1~~TRINITY_DN18472_c0_g1_i2.p1  ORF type:complete len:153 (+),score=58.93 TRINITY_DN18472_c0_g1_i2:77-535(+)